MHADESTTIFKRDVLGRVTIPKAQREALLDEFERSGLKGKPFAKLVGVNYQTFAVWIQNRRRARGDYAAAAITKTQAPAAVRPPRPLRLIEAVSASHGAGQVEITATRTGVGVGGGAVSTTRRGWLYIPPQSEEVEHDLVGNLLENSRWTYSWDAENRLRSVEEKPRGAALEALPAESAPPPRQRLEFSYDYQGRRVRKVVKRWSAAGSAFTVVESDRRFQYERWNLIAEWEAVAGVAAGGAPRLLRSYGWCVDASGTTHGAGGVGGLLFVHEHAAPVPGSTAPPPVVRTLTPFYGGAWNVQAYVDVERREITHTFEYDAFGNELGVDGVLEGADYGPTAQEPSPFRFSTKYRDRETGMLYYGFRYYSPEMGRWISADPIGVRGGSNLYAMVANNAVNNWDLLGLFLTSCTAENCGSLKGEYETLCQRNAELRITTFMLQQLIASNRSNGNQSNSRQFLNTQQKKLPKKLPGRLSC